VLGSVALGVLSIAGAMFVVMWTWSRGSNILAIKTHRDSIPIADMLKMLRAEFDVHGPIHAIMHSFCGDTAMAAA